MTNIEKAENIKGKSKKTCPICKLEVSEQYFPFCSKRCADVDLNRWLKGAYALPAEESFDDKISTLSNELKKQSDSE